MILYFGAPKRYTQVKSAEQAGSGRKGEESRPDFRDMVFLTSEINTARYYGRYVYKVQADAVLYWQEYERRSINGEMNRIRTPKKIQKKVKVLKRNETIFVAHPENVSILSIDKYECRNKSK
jgi:hypothetical protein